MGSFAFYFGGVLRHLKLPPSPDNMSFAQVCCRGSKLRATRNAGGCVPSNGPHGDVPLDRVLLVRLLLLCHKQGT